MFCHAVNRHLRTMNIALPRRRLDTVPNSNQESGRFSSDQIARKTSVPLVPPKPKEFDRATLIFICLAVLGT